MGYLDPGACFAASKSRSEQNSQKPGLTGGRGHDILGTLISNVFFARPQMFNMDNSDEYWRRALAAHSHARLATNEADRAAWLRIAESYATLFRQVQSEEIVATGIVDVEPNELASMN
ncbi:MAG: hypothetical protein ACREEK_11470 [Bradyrhizobium sp.]